MSDRDRLRASAIIEDVLWLNITNRAEMALTIVLYLEHAGLLAPDGEP